MNRGYFAMGVEGISKPGNVGNLVRSSHSFGASFFFKLIRWSIYAKCPEPTRLKHLTICRCMILKV